MSTFLFFLFFQNTTQQSVGFSREREREREKKKNREPTIHSSEADELADKHEDEQHPAASPEEQPAVPHHSVHQPTAMETSWKQTHD